MSTDTATVAATIVDATVVDDEPAGALVHQPRVNTVLTPFPVKETREAMQTYQQGLRSILDSADWQGKPDAKGSFVKKSGWRKISRWFGLNLELVRDEVERDDQGTTLRATVWARAIAPNGQYADGDGHCAYAESRFSGPRGNTQKLENDLRATAATRATNRAISNLVGMGAVSAEEVESGAEQGPPYGPEATDEQEKKLLAALAFLLGDEALAVEAYNRIGSDAGYVPRLLFRAFGLAGAVLKEHRDTEASADDLPWEGDEPEPEAAA